VVQIRPWAPLLSKAPDAPQLIEWHARCALGLTAIAATPLPNPAQ
jgi:hypothetical protein